MNGFAKVGHFGRTMTHNLKDSYKSIEMIYSEKIRFW